MAKLTTGEQNGHKVNIMETGDINSVEISKNARGGYVWKIKLYAEDAGDLPTKLAEIDKRLRNKFEKED